MTSVSHSRRIPGRTVASPELPRSSRERMGRTGEITEHGRCTRAYETYRPPPVSRLSTGQAQKPGAFVYNTP